MRVSVTITDEMNEYLKQLAEAKGLSKDKLISEILTSYREDITLPKSYYEGTVDIQSKVIQELKNENDMLKDQIEKFTLKNVRGAGRKAKFGETEIYEMKDYKEQGYTIKQIADIFKCSVGLVHKLINE